MKRSFIRTITGVAWCATLAIALLTSCDNVIYDDVQPCPHGVRLRFVYDYNMEFANAFPSKVHCVTLLVYDSQGNYVTRMDETGNVLGDENYRMQIDLEAGSYRLVAYGGIACPQASFFLSGEETYTGLQASLRFDENDGTSDRKLHDLFFGSLEVTVSEDAYREETVYLMKDTNNIRVVLQQLNGEPVEDEMFAFRITDDNTLFNSANSLIPNETVTYLPWTQGQQSVGTSENGETEVITVYAELSTSRLVTGNAPRLVILRTDTETEIVNIPLINYLLLLKSELYREMGAQEFLDRESEWSLIFFLDSGYDWINTHIVINDWTVRLNQTEL